MKAKRVLLVVLMCILSLLGRLILATAMAAFAMYTMSAIYTDGSTAPEPKNGLSLVNWMQAIEDDTLVTNIAMGGSHDAGCMDMMWAYQTQNTSIAAQLACGTRYFDLRVADDEGTLRIFHADMLGVDFLPILSDIRAFLTNNPSEFVVLDFQHFFNEDVVDAQKSTFNAVESALSDLAVHNDTDMDDLTFVKSLRLADCRGKCLVFWGRRGQYEQTDWVFLRDDDAGRRPDAALHSYYVTEYNTQSSAKYIADCLPVYWRQYEESNGGLFVLQGQLTDRLYVFGPAYREVSHADNMNDYLLTLPAEKAKAVNIVMRDYVTPRKNIITLTMNLAKGVVKAEYRDIFAEWRSSVDYVNVL